MSDTVDSHSKYDAARTLIWLGVMAAIVWGGFSRGFGKADNFWLGWELVAVLATAIYTFIVFFFDMLFFRGSEILSPAPMWVFV